MTADGKGLSAAAASKVSKRTTLPRLIEKPKTYSITDPKTGIKHEGTFKVIAALCPKVKVSTLQRRLDRGIRALAELKKPASKGRPEKNSKPTPGSWRK